jgi:hypothetical protein
MATRNARLLMRGELRGAMPNTYTDVSVYEDSPPVSVYSSDGEPFDELYLFKEDFPAADARVQRMLNERHARPMRAERRAARRGIRGGLRSREDYCFNFTGPRASENKAYFNRYKRTLRAKGIVGKVS